MSMVARRFTDYGAALVMSLEEEISGEVYFARLADFFSGREREALLMLAEVEAATANAVRPLVERYGFAVADAETLRLTGVAEAEKRRDLSWAELVDEMATDFPAYIEEFESIDRMAPEADRAETAVLVAHEVAAVDFARMEAGGDPASTKPLEAFLARYGRPGGELGRG